MCRRITLCFLSFVLVCCSCLGVAMADDVSDDDASVSFEQFLQELGFDTEDEEEISLFLTWLYPLQPGNAHEMGLILSGSDYSTLDSDMVYSLWVFLQAVIDESEFYWAGDNTGGTGTSSQGTVSIGYIGWLPSQPTKIYLMERLPNNAADAGKVGILATIDFAAILAEQGYLTQASLTTVETLIRETNSLLSLGNTDRGLIYTRLGNLLTAVDLLHTDLDLLHTDWVLSYNRLGLMANDLDSLLSVSKDIRTVLTRVDSNIDYIRTQFPEFFSFSRSWSFDSATNSIKSAAAKSLGIAELLDTNFKDLDSLLLKNFGSSSGFYYYSDSFTSTYLSSGASLFEVLSAVGSTLSSTLGYSDALTPMLFSSGDVDLVGQPVLSFSVIQGFLGLNTNMEKALIGGHDGSAEYSQLTFDENLNKTTKTVNYTDLLHAMVGIGSHLQNPLSQLQAVLAGDADLELHRNTQENIDSVTDNFTGSGDGAVSSGDISDASGLTAGIGDAFGGNQVSAGDFFSVAGDSGLWSFFTEESAQSLDAVTYPAAAVLDVEDDSWLDDYVSDENGFYSLADQSGWSILDYLGKEG